MIIENTETLEVVTDGFTTTESAWTIALAAGTGSVYTQASSETGATNGTTAVAMVTGAASTQKRVLGLTVYNRDSVSRIITIRRSATLPVVKATLAVGATLCYEAGAGWFVHAL